MNVLYLERRSDMIDVHEGHLCVKYHVSLTAFIWEDINIKM